MSWDEPARDENGKLTPHKMIFDVATYIIERMIIPGWMYRLGIEKLNQIDEAYNRFEEFMHERITEGEIELQKIRVTEGGEGRLADTLNSIFKRLVNSRLSEGKNSLSDREIIGNCFAFVSRLFRYRSVLYRLLMYLMEFSLRRRSRVMVSHPYIYTSLPFSHSEKKPPQTHSRPRSVYWLYIKTSKSGYTGPSSMSLEIENQYVPSSSLSGDRFSNAIISSQDI